MTDAAAFLQAICAAPDDRDLRLIFADWLEERGDPRGEFIRVQCELSERGPGHPDFARLESRDRQLRAAHEFAWVEPVGGWAEDWEFHRGFVERITIRPADFLEHAEEIFRLAPLKHVHFFRRNHLTRSEIEELARSPYLSRLEGFKLNTDRGIRDDSVPALAGCRHLANVAFLDLSDNWIGNDGARLLAGSPHLVNVRRLCLERNPLGREGRDLLRARFGSRVVF